MKNIGWKDESTPEEIRKWGIMIENRINEIIDYLNQEEPEEVERICRHCGYKEVATTGEGYYCVECGIWNGEQPDNNTEERTDIDIFMELLRKHSLVNDVHFYRGDGEREIVIKLN